MLDEELYSKDVISYSKNKTATLAYRFLLRTTIVDQSTPHSQILANLSGNNNDYISSQGLIIKATIEKSLIGMLLKCRG